MTNSPTPDQTAEKVLTGTLGRLDLTFTEFRARMIEEHPDYLDDETMHRVFVTHTASTEALRTVVWATVWGEPGDDVGENAMIELRRRGAHLETEDEIVEPLTEAIAKGRAVLDEGAAHLQRDAERQRMARQAKAEAHAARCVRNAERARKRGQEPVLEPGPLTFSERVRAAWDVLRSRA